MLFNSIEFLFFLPVVFALYWTFKRSLKIQNLILVVASYIFYGWWDWRFLILIFFSSIVEYLAGWMIYSQADAFKRKVLLAISLTINFGVLGFFKYYNFFTESLYEAFMSVGIHLNETTLKIVLPVGISFYTLQTVSYTLDIYFGKLKATKDFISFLSFVSFFPQLVAGPIERAGNLLPQFEKPRTFSFDMLKDGLRQSLWGLFKKIVIADNCGIMADYIFGHYHDANPFLLIMGPIFFGFQIYCDFSGYSDIALGTAKMFGFQLMKNFDTPYFALNIPDFWRRWHISLSSWFKDYLFIPLGGSRNGKSKMARNILLTFGISGLWHGANWTFIFWGLLNGLFYLGHSAIPRKQPYQIKTQLNIAGFIGMLLTFTLVTSTWIFFRSENIDKAFIYITNIFINPLPFSFSLPEAGRRPELFILLVLVIEWIQRKKEHPLKIEGLPLIVQWIIYWILIALILGFFEKDQSFIYFQF